MRFQKVLVANRGEIALRIIRTCHDMGLTTVAVYSDADAGAPFVRTAHEAISLGGTVPAESYLDIDKILQAARMTGAEAIHPGYGFLAENAEFATKVMAAGLVFVGPDPVTIGAMGDKAAARRLMESKSIPVVPGYNGDEQDDDAFALAADAIGYPLLVKAVAGGGGKGMSVVKESAELNGALAAARRIASTAFGDETLILERYIPSPRHIEVQIFGDTHGNVVHCFERECSIQRRFQKVIEEAPSPSVDPELRPRLTAAACAAGRALGYVGAGTVEFIVDPEGQFYFLEVNTRLQVEHPVTECVTGLDLVALQLRVAQGKALPPQDEIVMDGHAIEARLYAEIPHMDFQPSTGEILYWHVPEKEGLRVDSGVETGSIVGIDYDPMLAKVIADGSDRSIAIERLRGGLRAMRVAGVETNRDYLVDILNHDVFESGHYHTHFLADYFSDWVNDTPTQRITLRLVGALTAGAINRAALNQFIPGLRPGFRIHTNYRLVEQWQDVLTDVHYGIWYEWRGSQALEIHVDDEQFNVAIVHVDTHGLVLEVQTTGTSLGIRYSCRFFGDDERIEVIDGQGRSQFRKAPRFPHSESVVEPGACSAPMPGRISAVMVAEGERVEVGAVLVILEAMKMEQKLSAGIAGRVKTVNCASGDVVDAGTVLVAIEPEEISE